MAINNIDDSTLTTTFTIVHDEDSQDWALEVKRINEHTVKKGVDVAMGPLKWSANKSNNSTSTITSVFNEKSLGEHIDRLRASNVADPTPYEKALSALQDFKDARPNEGYEVLRLVNTFKTTGNILTGRKAVLRVVESTRDGNQTETTRTFDKQNLARYAFQLDNCGEAFWVASFYERALNKIGGTTRGREIGELLKPVTSAPAVKK